MAKVSPLAIAPVLIFAALIGFFLVSNERGDDSALPSTFIGKEAPPVALVQLGDSAPFTDATLRDGHVKLVNYWASWCAPCRIEAPTLDKIASSGIPIYGVNYKDNPTKALKFLADYGMPYDTMGADPAGQMAINWGVSGVPETFVIDGKGVVRLRFPGPITPGVWENTIKPAIEKAAAEGGTASVTN